MSKKLPTLLLLPLLGLGSGCSSDHMKEDIIDSPIKIGTETIVIKEGSTKENLKRKILYEKAQHSKSKLRSFYLDHQEKEILRLASKLLNNNFYNLNGGLYQILGTTANRNQVGLTTSGNSVWGNRMPGDSFYIEALPSIMGVPYIIYKKNTEKNFLGAGSLQRGGTKKSVAYIGPNSDSLFGSGWDIIPTEKGLLMKNDMVYTKNDESPTMSNVEKRVLACSSLDNGRIILASQDENDATQMFSIVPQEKFDILGIRYFLNGSQLLQAVYDRDIPKSLGDEVLIIDSLATYKDTNDYGYTGELRAKVSQMPDIKVERIYTNNTYGEVPVDLYFDKRVRQYSTYEEACGIKFPVLSNSEFPIPSINGQALKYSPRNVRTAKAPYKSNYIDRDLKGVLYLLISPRTKATVEYTYSVYRIELPYLIFLSPSNSTSDKIVYTLGIWKGYIYAEQDSDKHRFRKTAIDNNDGGNNDEIIFELSNSDLLRSGYKVSKSYLRSASTMTKRIHL